MRSTDTITAVVDRARSYVGYRSLAQKNNDFGTKTGTNGFAWDGAFLETVLRESGVTSEPSLTNTTAALAEYARTARFFRKPQVGDIAFFGFSTDSSFGQPHVGLVVDVSQYKLNGYFQTVEGQTASGLPMGGTENNGVYDRVRYATDAPLFARPLYRKLQPQVPGNSVPTVRPADFQPGKVNKKTVLLQSALHQAIGAVGMTRGKYDRATAAGVAAYQRKIGYVGTAQTGTVDAATIKRLALETNYVYFKGATDVE